MTDDRSMTNYFSNTFSFSERKTLHAKCQELSIKIQTINAKGCVVYKRDSQLKKELLELGIHW